MTKLPQRHECDGCGCTIEEKDTPLRFVHSPKAPPDGRIASEGVSTIRLPESMAEAIEEERDGRGGVHEGRARIRLTRAAQFDLCVECEAEERGEELVKVRIRPQDEE